MSVSFTYIKPYLAMQLKFYKSIINLEIISLCSHGNRLKVHKTGLEHATFPLKDQYSSIEPLVHSSAHLLQQKKHNLFLFNTNQLILLLFLHPQICFFSFTHTPGYQLKYIHPTSSNKSNSQLL